MPWGETAAVDESSPDVERYGLSKWGATARPVVAVTSAATRSMLRLRLRYTEKPAAENGRKTGCTHGHGSRKPGGLMTQGGLAR